MMGRFMILVLIGIFACVQAGVVPAAVVAPYATSYNSHVVNHAVATPLASPYVAAASPYVAAASPYVASPYVASPYVAAGAAYPYVFSMETSTPGIQGFTGCRTGEFITNGQFQE